MRRVGTVVVVLWWSMDVIGKGGGAQAGAWSTNKSNRAYFFCTTVSLLPLFSLALELKESVPKREGPLHIQMVFVSKVVRGN